MRLHIRQAPDREPGEKKAQLTIKIRDHSRAIFLAGTIIRETQPGWLTCDIPQLDRWDESLRWLSQTQFES